MTDHNIPCKAWEVKALLAGTKCRLSRRAWRIDKHVSFRTLKSEEIHEYIKNGWRVETRGDGRVHVDLPTRFQKIWAGDRICVLEDVARSDETMAPVYLADGAPCPFIPPTELMHARRMPQHASRLTLLVTSVSFPHLRSTTSAAAIAEGVQQTGKDRFEIGECFGPTPETAYRALWERINGRNSWLINPELVAIRFKIARSNILDLGAEAA